MVLTLPRQIIHATVRHALGPHPRPLHWKCLRRSSITRRVSTSALLRTWCALRCAFLATILFSVAYALLVSLAALFGTRSLYFQWLADSFVEYWGVGYPSSLPQHARIFRSATWTRAAHPTIIAVSSRFQVHG